MGHTGWSELSLSRHWNKGMKHRPAGVRRATEARFQTITVALVLLTKNNHKISKLARLSLTGQNELFPFKSIKAPTLLWWTRWKKRFTESPTLVQVERLANGG